VITLTRLNGQRFALNPDLIERVDVTPDTVLTLIDGAKYLVAETLDQVIAEIRAFRASIVAMANRTEVATDVTAIPPTTTPSLRVVSDAEEG
jgi:flagellar protein FlbD